MGKRIDLDPVYKQCPVAMDQDHVACIALQNPFAGKGEYFEALALPFGSSAAVHGFNRAVVALNVLLHEGLGVPCIHHFDDFTTIAPDVVAPMDEASQRFMDCLGWFIKQEKAKPMAAQSVVLGVVFDFSDALPSRIEGFSQAIEGTVSRGVLTRGGASRLRGRLVFSNSRTFGGSGVSDSQSQRSFAGW